MQVPGAQGRDTPPEHAFTAVLAGLCLIAPSHGMLTTFAFSTFLH